MNQRDYIELPLNSVMKSDLLIAPVALIHRIEQHRKWERQVARLRQALCAFKGLVMRRIVDNQYFCFVVGKRVWNSSDHALNRLLGVVRNDEDENPPL